MARFIAFPKHDNVILSLDLTEVRFSSKAREGQINRLSTLRLEAGQSTEIVDAAREFGLNRVAGPGSGAPITGVTVLEGQPSSLTQLQTRCPNYELIEDAPLTLVRPTNMSATTPSIDTWHLDAIQLTSARQFGFSGTGMGVGVAVLDTGIEEVNEIMGRVVNAFRLDPATGNAVQITTYDTHGHGTHVAGLVAGSTVGVAPKADLMNFIMIPHGHGNISDFIFAIEFVATRPEISILNMSAGIHGFTGAMSPAISAILAVGILPVIAIGNEGPNTSRSPGNYSNVLSIGASTRNNSVAYFSGGGTMNVNNQIYTVPEMVAPGQDVTSCVVDGNYQSWSGTSMATPIVSGLAALIIEQNPMITEPNLRSEIMSALQTLPGIPADRQGNGLAQLPQYLWPQVT